MIIFCSALLGYTGICTMFRAILPFASVVAIDIFFRPVKDTIIYSMFMIRNRTRAGMDICSPSVNHPNDLAAASCSFIADRDALQIKVSRMGINAPMSNETVREDAT